LSISERTRLPEVTQALRLIFDWKRKKFYPVQVARTLADLEGKEALGEPHVSEAIQYRTLDRELF
jgi:predicted ATPase with chaperone activity